MLPLLTYIPPTEENLFYEIKYDGYRGILEWHENSIHLWSRNGKDLLPQFPEIKSFLSQYIIHVQSLLPLILDGEIVALESCYKANFQRIQQRGKMRSEDKIKKEAKDWPCQFLAFDLLTIGGKKLQTETYRVRKQKLEQLFDQLQWPLQPNPRECKLVQYVPPFFHLERSLRIMKDYNSEGIVAKRANSEWKSGKRTSDWVKYKNFKIATCFITGMDETNGYFHVGVWDKQTIVPIGLFLFGIDRETKAALRTIIQENYVRKNGTILELEPSICVDLFYLQWIDGQLREPHFHQLRFDLHPNDCTFEQFLVNEAAFPETVTITSLTKPLWDHMSKLDYLRYLRQVAPFMLPYLKERPLTIIRAPHGIFGESFYQKNRPEFTPTFVTSALIDEIDYIVCNDLKTFIWLGNQLAIEFHIPFQTINSHYVSEIVFDLDPPDRAHFQLAVKGAIILKKVLDQFQLTSFVKISGNKGMQVYIPLQEGRFNWDDTKSFTSFIAHFLVSYNPQLFTIERLKKKRGKRLYVDYVQHRKGKTIIAPYSVRFNEEALVASPIDWDELTEELDPTQFTIHQVLERLKRKKDPFTHFFSCKEKQPFDQVLQQIKNDH